MDFKKGIKFLYVDIKNVEICVDENIVPCKDEKWHHKILIKVLGRAGGNNLTLIKDKFSFKTIEVKYLGYRISNGRIEDDSSHIKVTEKCLSLKISKGVSRFLLILNYVSKFMSKTSKLTAPLRNLLKLNNEFIWSHQHENAFVNIEKNSK